VIGLPLLGIGGAVFYFTLAVVLDSKPESALFATGMTFHLMIFGVLGALVSALGVGAVLGERFAIGGCGVYWAVVLGALLVVTVPKGAVGGGVLALLAVLSAVSALQLAFAVHPDPPASPPPPPPPPWPPPPGEDPFPPWPKREAAPPSGQPWVGLSIGLAFLLLLVGAYAASAWFAHTPTPPPPPPRPDEPIDPTKVERE
jgi:hypothetical protein